MKRKLIKALSVLAYYAGIDCVFYWLNRKAKRIVTFHNVLPAAVLPREEESLICFDDEKFKRIVEVVGCKFRFSNEMRDAGSCTITFDDGYLNQLEVAGRILREQNIPAVLFLAHDLLGSEKPLVVDQCLMWSNKVPMEIAETSFERKIADHGVLWREIVRPLFAADGEHRGREALAKLDAIWPMEKAMATYSSEFRRLRFSGVSKMLVNEFKQAGWIIGHHTYSHFPVKNLDAGNARKEMIPPNGMENIVFSFPYGNGESVSLRDVQLAKELGYSCAVSNEVEKTPLSGRHFLPRFMLTTDDKYMIHFQLSGLKYFLKYRRLLPVCAF